MTQAFLLLEMLIVSMNAVSMKGVGLALSVLVTAETDLERHCAL